METILVPAAFLHARGVSASAKVVWMASRLPDHRTSVALQAATGLSHVTVRKALAELAASPWTLAGAGAGHPQGVAAGRTAGLPAGLLGTQHIGAQAKLLYGLLQLTRGFTGKRTTATYAELSELTGTSPNTVKLAVKHLADAGWLQVSQERRKLPLDLVLLNPVRYRQKQELAMTTREVAKARSRGEGLMRGFLSLLVASDLFEDDAEPGFLINPVTGEHLQFDRFYPPAVAFEYNGAQHYGTTDWFPNSDEAKEQRLRDLIKAGICVYRGISLVVVHAEDLSLEGMRRKVGNLLPLRDLTGHELRVRNLEKMGAHYRRAAVTQAGE